MNIQFPSGPTEFRTAVPPARRKTLAAMELLGRSIVAGRYPVEGGNVTEAELCRHFGFARGSLRDAVSLLRSKGLVDLSPRLGLWVQPESFWDLLDADILRWLLDRIPSRKLITELYELRLAIQPSAARLAAEASDKHAHAVMADALNFGALGFVQAGELNCPAHFHIAVLRATKNRWFVQMSDMISGALRLTDRYTVADPDAAVLNAQFLPAIAQAILDSEPDVAERHMRILIAGERQLVLPKLTL